MSDATSTVPELPRLPGVDLFDDSPVVVFRWQAAAGWPVVYVSNSVRQLGVEPAQLLSGEVPYSSLVHPDDLARVAQEVGDFTAAGRTNFEQDYRLILPGGRMIWIYDYTRVLRDASGNATHYDGYIFDITQRKNVEAALQVRVRESEAQQQAIASMSSPIIEVWDGVLTLPVIGVMNSHRAQLMSQQLLDRVIQTRSSIVVLDLTGMEIVDTHTTSHLLRIVQALRLLGTRCALCGISPHLAQSIAHLDISLEGVPTVSTLKAALRMFITESAIESSRSRSSLPFSSPQTQRRKP